MPVKIPRATYRFQFHKDFTFRDARALLPYLQAMGISDVYASPIFRAAPGSMHGYDICDHNALNPEIGTPAEFDDFVSELHRLGLGLIVDFVPNHMGIAEPQNDWWMDVLENGPSSPYARFFDIDWQPLKRELENKVLLPILGDQYGRVLATCRVGGEDIGDAVVRAGWAVADLRYAGAVLEARRAGRGIWSGRFIDPAEWRRTGGEPQFDLWGWLLSMVGR